MASYAQVKPRLYVKSWKLKLHEKLYEFNNARLYETYNNIKK